MEGMYASSGVFGFVSKSRYSLLNNMVKKTMVDLQVSEKSIMQPDLFSGEKTRSTQTWM